MARMSESTPEIETNKPTLPVGKLPATPAELKQLNLAETFRVASRTLAVVGLRLVPEPFHSWRYEDYLRYLDKPLLTIIARSGARSSSTLTEHVNRVESIATKPKKTGIREIAQPTTEDWLASAWRRGLVAPLSNRLAPGDVHSFSHSGRSRTRAGGGSDRRSASYSRAFQSRA